MSSDLERTFETHLKCRGNRSFVCEHRFMSTRKFSFDFAWPELMIAVEIEGGTFSNGRHTRGSGFTKDCEKYNLATKLGWKVFRFTGEQVTSGEAINFMKEIL